MHAAEVRAGDDLVSSRYGPEEPPRRKAVEPKEIDAVVAPGLAFDRSGFRIGYGGGHFDRYLALMRPSAIRIGIAFHLQVVDEAPHGPGDVPLDFLVTERETIACGRP